MASEQERPPVFLTRLRVESYRSIASCDVSLGPLTVLAGPNAAGKSNVLDAIRFVRDALQSSPGRALERRGGLEEVLHRDASGGQADVFRIQMDLDIPASRGPAFKAAYLLEVGTRPDSDDPGPVLRREELRINGRLQADAFIPELAGEHLVSWRDDILLPQASRTSREAGTVFRSLTHMRFYELLTPVLRAVDDTPQRRGDRPLGESGEHLGRVLDALSREHPWVKDTVDGYLATMIDNAVGLDGVEVREADLAFVVGRFLGGEGQVVKVDRRALSEGTLRLAGVLAALFQPRALRGSIPLIALEEPEISLHPPMLGALYDALAAAARNTQVMVTTQSADLLDNAAADPSHLLVARDDGAGTVIGPIDPAGRQLLADGVLTLSELLRSGELRPATPSARRADQGEDSER
ncbi:AAA family ATPase [Streptomyces sp. V4I2]|uniref:AAA family ATPase n=1 Tax=Streptomyces sp. V4I2 TaxID=3042280 RepID=UPI002780422F|nr:AAA family ATPase [Streptomyces sp. V4I2]MDQ1041842.1 putative ATPase [Streptomyces sp. V4I2]